MESKDLFSYRHISMFAQEILCFPPTCYYALDYEDFPRLEVELEMWPRLR